MSDNIKEKKVERWFWGRKRVTKKVYDLRCKQQKFAENIQKVHKEKKDSEECTASTAPTKMCEIEGRRIIHPSTLAHELFCTKCGSILSLVDCIQEKLLGLASMFYIQCRSCKTITAVNSDKTHEVPSKKRHYDVNTKAVVGKYCMLMHVLCYSYNVYM